MREKQFNASVRLGIATVILVFLLVGLSILSDTEIDHIVLNEVCCYNDTIIYDTIGVYRDYVEIYNPTESDKDISGYYISDNKDNLMKYMIPENVVLGSEEYLFIWAGTWTTGVLIEDASYYMGFSLKPGETIYLSDSDGNVLDKIKIPKELEADISYSRVSTSANVWKMTEASPGFENYTDLPEQKVYLDVEVMFSNKSGFYDEPFYLEMETNEEYDIYYTLDGSMPTVESTKYEEAIFVEDASENENKYANIGNISLVVGDIYLPNYRVEKATVIRAIAVDKNGVASKGNSATYFVSFEEKAGFQNIATISLITDPKNLFDYKLGIYVKGELWDLNSEKAIEASEYWEYVSPANYLSKGKGWRREATLQYFDESGNLLYEQQVDLGSHGRRSLSNNQKSLNLYALPEVDGNEYVCEGIFGYAESTLMLRNGGWRDCYSTKLRDVLNQELVNDRDLTVSDFQPCQVFIDGEYWGLYMLQERISESMIASRYSVEEENVILTKNDEVVAGKTEDIELWNDVLDFARENDLFFEKNYRKIEQMIDIQSCIDHYCFQIYIANCDSLSNNYSMWRVRDIGSGEYEDGRWRWAIYDTDDSAAILEGRTTADANSFVEGNWGHNVSHDELFVALIRNEEFKQKFVTTFMDIANYNFDAENVLARIDELSSELSNAMVVSQKRFYSENYTENNYLKEINKLKNFFANRYDYITAHLKSFLMLEGELVPLTVKNSVGGTVKLNTLVINEEEEFTGNYYSDYCVSLSAVVTEGYEFLGWNIDGQIYEGSELKLDLFDEYTVIPIYGKE